MIKIHFNDNAEHFMKMSLEHCLRQGKELKVFCNICEDQMATGVVSYEIDCDAEEEGDGIVETGIYVCPKCKDALLNQPLIAKVTAILLQRIADL